MNPMKYYVNADGNYLGGWDDNPPEGAIEVPFPPDDARQIWQMPDGPWSTLPPQPYTLDVSILWLRLSEEEAEEFDGIATTAGPLKMRKAFATASSLSSTGDLFTWVRNILIGLFGETRADELLAEATNETSSIVAPVLEE